MVDAVVTGSGRSGTTSIVGFLAASFDPVRQRRPTVRHESDAAELVGELLRGDIAGALQRLAGFTHDIEVSPYLALVPMRPVGMDTRIVTVIRDGRDVITSGLSLGWFVPRPPVPPWEALLPPFGGDRFEKSCRYWAWVNATTRSWGAAFFRLEDLASSSGERHRLLGAVGLDLAQQDVNELPHRNRAEHEKEARLANGDVGIGPWPEWSDEQRACFTDICGPTMNRYYPRWNWDTANHS